MGDDGIVKILGIGEVRVVRIGQPGGWKLPAISNLIHASNTRYNFHGIGDVFHFKICLELQNRDHGIAKVNVYCIRLVDSEFSDYRNLIRSLEQIN